MYTKISFIGLNPGLFALDLNADMIKVSGEFEIGSQYHFHMETQSVIVRPVEDFQVKKLVCLTDKIYLMFTILRGHL